MSFKLSDTNKYYLKGTGNRFLHLATITRSLKEYIVFQDILLSKIYIEEITGGHLSFIEDESLAKDLEYFAKSKGLLDMKPPGKIRMEG